MVIVKMERHEEELRAYGPTTTLGNFRHGIHLSHGRYHVKKTGIAGMAGAKISQSIVDIAQKHSAAGRCSS